MRIVNWLKSVAGGRIFIAWLFWATAMMSNAIVGVLIQRFVESRLSKNSEPLVDIGFEILPYIHPKSFGVSIPDLCSLVSATLVALSLVVHFSVPNATILLRRVLVISGVAYFGRAVSIPQTLLPNPDASCIPNLNGDSVLVSAILVPFGGAVTCTDVFYSGHTIPITCAIMVWLDYMRTNRLRWLGISVSSFALLGIIATHFHYTVDVFYGMAITYFLWRIYHFALSCPAVFHYLPWVVWWEAQDAVGDGIYNKSEKSAGVYRMDLSRDPRIIWTYSNEDKKQQTCPSPKLSKAQLLLLLIVTLTLSPSWIAVYHGATFTS